MSFKLYSVIENIRESDFLSSTDREDIIKILEFLEKEDSANIVKEYTRIKVLLAHYKRVVSDIYWETKINRESEIGRLGEVVRTELLNVGAKITDSSIEERRSQDRSLNHLKLKVKKLENFVDMITNLIFSLDSEVIVQDRIHDRELEKPTE